MLENPPKQASRGVGLALPQPRPRCPGPDFSSHSCVARDRLDPFKNAFKANGKIKSSIWPHQARTYGSPSLFLKKVLPANTGSTFSQIEQRATYVKKGKNTVIIYDVPAAVYGSRLDTYIRKAKMIIVPVMPSPIDIKAAREFLNNLRSLGPVIRNKIKVGLVANRARANTNIFLELDDYLVKEKGLRYITAFRDNTNYIKSARSGLGIFEMGESATAQDREEWKPLIRWLGL